LNTQFLTIWDIVLAPIFLGILIFIAKRHREKKYPVGHPLRKYYLPGLYAKFGGAVFIALIYQYYYGNGDTFFYFTDAQIINSSLNSSPTTWLKLIIGISPDLDPKLFPYVSQMNFYNNAPSHAVSSITAILGLFNGTSYIPIALLLAFISYTGIWSLYKTFAGIYPKLVRNLAIAFLFVPSVFVWGSAIFKDTVCMFGLGWITYTTFRIFINRDFSIVNISLLVISFYLLAVIKVYILLAFLPALVFWLLTTYSVRIRIAAIKFFLYIVVAVIVVSSFVYVSRQFETELNRYSLENILNTSESTKNYIAAVSEREEGSTYNLGSYDPSFIGILSKIPAGVNVTLFRPYLWEAKKPIMALSAVESLTFFILTIMVLFKNGVLKTFQKIFNDANLLFLFTFTFIFAFAVGMSSYNFGALSRYKIPCMPFYAAFLMILLYKEKKRELIRPLKHRKPQMSI
jgi:hypothetical protein